MSPSPRKSTRKGRSKSIGPGSLDEPEPPKRAAKDKDRRKSAFIPTTATKSILSKDEADAKAARRKSMMNRRVSFAPEATLHTWDIIVDQAHDQTTSTDSAESTRRGSAFRGSSSSPGQSSDVDDFTPSAQDAEDAELLSSPVAQDPGARKSSRRSSGIPPMNFNNPEDFSSSGASGSDDSGEEVEDEGDLESGDETGTAMSLDIDDNNTMQSVSDASTSSSTRIELALQQAAKTAGTRGIAYDEFGDMSMEIAGEEITNAFKPWAQQNANEPHGSASLDQENINPFSPAFKADIASRPATIKEEEAQDEDEDEEDMSMDVTRAVGGILRSQRAAPTSSPASEGTMDFTQAVGKITGQKRRRSTTESGSPGEAVSQAHSKRRRSSVARSSMGDDTMDLTMAVGGIQSVPSLAKPERRRSMRNRRSSGLVSDADDATMELTRAVGGIQARRPSEDDSLVGNEELSMELTTVLGGIRAGQKTASGDSRPRTPQQPQSPLRAAANTTPKDQERFKDTPDLGAKQLLTPKFQEQSGEPTERQAFVSKPRLGRTPNASAGGAPETAYQNVPSVIEDQQRRTPTPRSSPAKPITYPDLTQSAQKDAPVRTPSCSPRRHQAQKTPTSELRMPQPSQGHALELSPTAEKQQRSTPAKPAAVTPEKRPSGSDSQNLTNTIKLMSTPRKETLKNVTPKKHTPAKQTSPVKAITPRGRPTPNGRQNVSVIASPARRLNEDLERIKEDGADVKNVGLQDFLTQAGIRFMDLTTTKRRMTTAPTPSKTRANGDTPGESEEAGLESMVVAAARTVPELELYQHACHELKRYTREGKQMISELEAATLQEQPPLIRAYVHATPDRRAALDAQMRDMKTNARFQSKEMWYAWRSQLLDELMVGLQNIAEGLIKDDETLGRSEGMVDQVLPKLVERHDNLQQEAERLEESVNAVSEEELEELETVREQISETNMQLAEKKLLLESLQRQAQEQDSLAENLHVKNAEFTAATQEANRVREACRGVSLNEITALKGEFEHFLMRSTLLTILFSDSVKQLEDTFGWSITSASSSPSTLTMIYQGEIQLFLHPQAFAQEDETPNCPIRLTYVADTQSSYKKKPLTTTLRFFLQLLQATLQGLPQCTTKLCDLLSLVSKGWDTAIALAESERRLSIEALTETKIIGDERLAVEATVLLPKVRTKVRATFEVTAMVGADLAVRTHVQPKVMVVYGEQYNEKNMTEYLRTMAGSGFEAWDAAVRGMREKLIARGVKGARK